MDRISWGEGEAVNKGTCGEKKRQPVPLPVVCLREREIGGGRGEVHGKKKEEEKNERMGRVSYMMPGAGGWR